MLYMNQCLLYGPARHESFVPQWLEHPTGVRKIVHVQVQFLSGNQIFSLSRAGDMLITSFLMDQQNVCPFKAEEEAYCVVPEKYPSPLLLLQTPHPPEISIPGGCLSYPPPTPGISVIFQLGWVTSGKDVCGKKKFLHYIFMRKIMFSAINEKHIFSFMLIPTFLRTFYLPCAVNVRICARGAYPISSNNSRGRLFFFSHQKGVIISNIAQWKSCPIDCFPMTSRQPYLCTKQ